MDNEEKNLKKYGIDISLGKYIIEQNEEIANEFNIDLFDYINKYYTKQTLILNDLNYLKNYYYNYIINNPNKWVVISNIFNPNEEESVNLLFEIINLLKNDNYNFEKKFNKLKIIR